MSPVLQQYFRTDSNCIPSADSGGKIIILRLPEGFVITEPKLPENLSSYHKTGMRQDRPYQHPAAQILRLSLNIRAKVLLSERLCAAADQLQLRMLLQIPELPLKPIRMRKIISVHPGNVLSLCQRNRQIQICSKSPVLFIPHNMDSWILILPQDVTGPVCGTVIHNNQLKILYRLFQGAVYRFLQIILLIINRHDHTDQRSGIFLFKHRFAHFQNLSLLFPFMFFTHACSFPIR